jgi:probable addiction module antidote protein
MKAVKANAAVLKKLGVKEFDVAEALNDKATIAEYLNQVLADGDANEIIRAVGHVARARGMKKVAEDAGVGRASLYKALKPGAKPQFDTILKVIGTFGVRLQVVHK